MKRITGSAWLAVVAIAVEAFQGCGGTLPGAGTLFSESQWEIVASLAAIEPVPTDATNRFFDDPDAARFGQQLFFESRYSGPLRVGDDGTNGGLGAEGETGRVSCASCHQPGEAFADARSKPGNVSLGVGYTRRNAPSLINVAYYKWYGWGGKHDTLWTQSSLSPENSNNTAGNRCGYAHMIWAHYRDVYEGLFGPLASSLEPSSDDASRFPEACKPKKNAEDPDGAWEMMSDADQVAVNEIMANCGKSVAAYERLLTSVDSQFDQYVAGDEAAISMAAKRGLKVFIGKAGCVACHKGPMFTDDKFHVTGVPQTGPQVPPEDSGRPKDLAKARSHIFNGMSAYSDDQAAGREKFDNFEEDQSPEGSFRTKNLRNVARSAPYFHTGGSATLLEVVQFYDDGGASAGFVGTKDARIVPLNLTGQERDDLVAFLETLTGTPIPMELRLDSSR